MVDVSERKAYQILQIVWSVLYRRARTKETGPRISEGVGGAIPDALRQYPTWGISTVPGVITASQGGRGES